MPTSLKGIFIIFKKWGTLLAPSKYVAIDLYLANYFKLVKTSSKVVHCYLIFKKIN